ncbi:uncharacterized protein LOC134540890 isoform X2 [Bacillus rossius redtenbacheri]|uniref:uncharacterized protein LOC134540890 isoform X2 n=1 Tax=Bacillus rossius redtenbacheri TaxID=93214 RepID=UPI002FDC9ED7
MEATMGECAEDSLDRGDIRSSAGDCRADVHLNGEVNGSCEDNVDLCGVISRDARSKLVSDVGNDSNHSCASVVGVEENGNADSSDSDGEEAMDAPSEESDGGARPSAQLTMTEDSRSRDVAMDTYDESVPSPATDHGRMQTSGVTRNNDSGETDEAGEVDDSEETGLAGLDDSEEIGVECKENDSQEIMTAERDDDSMEIGERDDIDDDAIETGLAEREDYSIENDFEGSDIVIRKEDLKETDVAETEDNVQERDSVEREDFLQETVNQTEDRANSVCGGSMEVEGDSAPATKESVEGGQSRSNEEASGSGEDPTGAHPEAAKADVDSANCAVTDSFVSEADTTITEANDSVKVSAEESSFLSGVDTTDVLTDDSVKVKAEESSTSSDKADLRLEDTPGKIKKVRKSSTLLNVTPRRSSRNLSKTQKTYSEHDEDPDIEEITPQDPLADPLSGGDKEVSKPRVPRNKTTIVVNDTKRLVEIAAGSKPSKGGKKEPTLVIIDTNSILSGRGPVPVSQNIQSSSSSSASAYSMLPMALPAQGLYPSGGASTASPTGSHNTPRTSTPVATGPSPRQQPQILPSLTDDMYVVEAPSFIVPYVYEKPPIKPLKEYVEGMGKELDKLKEERKALEADEQEECEKDTTSKDADESKPVKVEGGEEDRDDGEKPANETVDSPTQVKVTNEEGDGDKKHSDSLDSKQSKKLDVDELKDEVKSSDVNGDVPSESESKEGSKDDKEKGEPSKAEVAKPVTYFDNPLGKFFMQIGVNLVQEYVQTDLLRSQKKKRDREGGKGASVTQFAISSLLKNLELSKENNEPFHLSLKKCDFCSFKTESALVMAQHLETPHMKNYVYRCNFCTLEVRSPHDILFHMEAEHNVRGRLERAPAFHQCPNCPFEDNQKGKLSRHLISCLKKFKAEKNQEPPLDWEPPAKIPRVSRNRPSSMGIAYQALSGKQVSQHPLLPKLVPSPQLSGAGSSGRGRGRPPLHSRYLGEATKLPVQRPIAPTHIRQSMLYRSTASGSPMLVPTTYQISGNQIYQGQMMPVVSSGISPASRIALMSPSGSSQPSAPVALVPGNAITIQNAHKNNPTAKLLQQPSISITPLPRQSAATQPGPSLKQAASSSGGKATFVICEICDGYIKDLEQLRNHMQWIHKVKIHPKMIYNRPPLNCQKCQFRFFTDQGLERHLLGSHGLVTSSMQEAANKGKDGGRCPVCGRVYQWKLLNHVARDHNMTLKPAHLSYKCTVCTATFGMYKQFENHVYSAHSVVAKRVMDKKTSPSPATPRAPSDSLLKPLKINDEITIIPQPARPRPGPASRTGAVSAAVQAAGGTKVWQCDDCEATFDGPTGFAQFTAHVKRRHLRRCSVRLCRLDACPTCRRRHATGAVLEWLGQRSGVDVIELSDDEVVIGQGRSEITITKVACAPGPKRFKQRLQRAKLQVIELDDSPAKADADDSLTAVKERLRRRKSLEISQIDSDGSPQPAEDLPSKKRRKLADD